MASRGRGRGRGGGSFGRGYHAEAQGQQACHGGPSSSRREVLQGILKAWSPLEVVSWCCSENSELLDADLSSLAIHRAAKGGSQKDWGSPSLWSTLLSRLRETADEASIQHVCKAIWAFARLPYAFIQTEECLQSLDALQKRTEALAHDFDTQGVANVLHSFGTLRVTLGPTWTPRKRALKALAQRGAALIEQFTARDVANSLWAAARLLNESLRTFEQALLERLMQVAQLANGQELANCFWAFAVLHTADPPHCVRGVPRTFGRTLCAAASSLVESFNAQNVSNIVWAMGKLHRTGVPESSVVNDGQLLVALEARAAAEAHWLTTQGLTNVLWGLAKAGVSLSRDSGICLIKTLIEYSPKLDGKDASNALWALSMLLTLPSAGADHQATPVSSEESDAVDKLSSVGRKAANALCTRMEVLIDSLNDCDVASSLLAIAKLHESNLVKPNTGFVERLCARGQQVASGIRSAQAVWTMWSLAKLGISRKTCENFCAALYDTVAAAMPDLPDQELGVAAWAIAKLGVSDLEARGIVAMFWQVAKSLSCADGVDKSELANRPSWRTFGHVLFAERQLSGKVKPHEKLCRPALDHLFISHSAMRVRVAKAAASASATVLRNAALAGAGRILMIDDEIEAGSDGPIWQDALAEAGAKDVYHWRRFACGDEQVEPWPYAGSKRKECDLCVMRLPFHSGATRLALAAAVSCLKADGLLLLWCDSHAGALASARSLLAETKIEVCDVLRNDPVAVVLTARRGAKSALGRQSLQEWRTDVSIQLPLGSDAGFHKSAWCTYPGLFAGGGLDIMTAALLRTLPAPPHPSAKVLDFACGSGSIAASLMQRHPDMQVTLLDADAVAVEACRQNLPEAKRILVSDGWHQLKNRNLRFDWIVSNPPVHRGRLDDFRVLMDLVDGAGPRLRPDGVLWIVAQEYVPVGSLLGSFSDVTCPLDDGRFVVWRAAGWCGQPEDGAAACEPRSKRRKL
eukprot:TRINITY_DN21300_c0_g2_i1.p1 TRINITY_DN21300_c0_g2~~TRINITY_DN21300_c0_g2_i1.p1  ORF type:complete len:976 (+),score=137.92 TRINITY_DN21300_c0_g2_i1:96-3023(+)